MDPFCFFAVGFFWVQANALPEIKETKKIGIPFVSFL